MMKGYVAKDNFEHIPFFLLNKTFHTKANGNSCINQHTIYCISAGLLHY